MGEVVVPSKSRGGPFCARRNARERRLRARAHGRVVRARCDLVENLDVERPPRDGHVGC